MPRLLEHVDTSPGEIASDRPRVVALCRRLTGDADAAEDLAQEALLIAWHTAHRLHDAEARWPWLAGIARNVCRHWARDRGRDLHRLVRPTAAGAPLTIEDLPAGDDAFEVDLERDELARLLDRALALLPAETRTALIQHYIEESPQAEIAARLGLTEGAVEARIRRGRLALRRLLTTDLADEAVAGGLVTPEQVGWQATRLWCPSCGQARLEGWLQPDEGKLYLRCPACAHDGDHLIHAHLGTWLKDVRRFRPAVGRVLQTVHDLYRVLPVDGMVVCACCGSRNPLRRGTPPWAPSSANWPDCTYLWCPRCGNLDRETWHSLTWSLPETRRFWRAHPRMRFRPARQIEAAGGPAVVAGFECVRSGARLEAVMLRDSLRVLHVAGAPPLGASRAEGEPA
jgi:RNA polymerase sigma factor (sigma-70 family)